MLHLLNRNYDMHLYTILPRRWRILGTIINHISWNRWTHRPIYCTVDRGVNIKSNRNTPVHVHNPISYAAVAWTQEFWGGRRRFGRKTIVAPRTRGVPTVPSHLYKHRIHRLSPQLDANLRCKDREIWRHLSQLTRFNLLDQRNTRKSAWTVGEGISAIEDIFSTQTHCDLLSDHPRFAVVWAV